MILDNSDDQPQVNTTHSESLQAAFEYFDLGWMPIPIGYKQKNPTKPKWQDSRYQRQDLATVFPVKSNVGVLLGEPSKNI